LTCPNCGQTVIGPPSDFAQNVTCPRCGCLWRTPDTADIRHARTDQRLDFQDFCRLIKEAAPGRLQAALDGVGLRLSSPERMLIDSDGKSVDFEEAHVRVQESAAAQSALYQLAMDLWR
jgi:hypothetical protein